MTHLAIPVTAKDPRPGPPPPHPPPLVEYGDYQCPSCGDAFPLIQKLQHHFGDKLRFVFRNFPLAMHPYAEHAAETAEFAAAHHKFWEMHDLLFKHQSNLADASLLKLATQLKLSASDLHHRPRKTHLRRPRKARPRRRHPLRRHRTPMFYINGQLYDDAYDYDTLAAAIQAQQ